MLAPIGKRESAILGLFSSSIFFFLSSGVVEACADVHGGCCSLYCMLRQPSTGPLFLHQLGFMDTEVGERLPSRACLLDLCEPWPLCLLAFAFLGPFSFVAELLGFPWCQVEF